jgi:ABC-2 type transport system permease protein
VAGRAAPLLGDGRVSRLLKVLRVFWSTSWAAETEYRSNFIFSCISSVGTLFGSAFSIWLFNSGGAGFPGWTIEEGAVVLGLFSVYTGFVAVFLSPNLSRIVQHVEAGTLEFILLKPIDAQLVVSLRVFSPWGIPDVVLGGVIVVFGLFASGHAGWGSLLFVVPFVSGALLLYALWFLVATTSVWFTRIYNATEVLRGLLDAGRFPIGAYPAVYRLVFTFVVPVAFLTTVPAEALLRRASSTWLLVSPLVAVVAFVAARLFWRRALRSYTGASG